MKLSKTMAETDATALRAEFEEEGRRSKAQWFRICPGARVQSFFMPIARCLTLAVAPQASVFVMKAKMYEWATQSSCSL